MKATSLNRSTSKSRPALRLVSTKELPREDWLQIRKQGIGSSDAAAAVGLNPYKSQLELWMEKTGRDAGMPKADPQDEESPMYWGNVLEPIVAWHYSKRTKNKVRRINAVLNIRIRSCPGCWPTSTARWSVPTMCRSSNARQPA